MKYILILLTTIALSSCSDAFINHSLKYEKLGACSNEQVPIKVIANISGERYEFVSCLGDDFDGKNYLVERKGDSIIVSFPKSRVNPTAYKLTLDIDAKPPYRSIILDGREILIGQQ
jgi:hypothetical protein